MAGRARKADVVAAVAEQPRLAYAALEEEVVRNIDELRIRAYDDYLQLVTEMYLGDKGFEELFRLAQLPQPVHGLLGPVGGVLTSPYRQKEVLDFWSPFDISLFVGAITRYGRDWRDIQTALPHKSHAELTDFYYGVFKGLRIYPVWKKVRKLKGLEYFHCCFGSGFHK